MTMPSDWAIHGVAVLATLPLPAGIQAISPLEQEIVVVEELLDEPAYGKRHGMASIPMGSIRVGERESAEYAARREFKEEAGQPLMIRFPLGFFEIQEPDYERVGVWAFYGEVQGKIVPHATEEVRILPPMRVRDLLALPPFAMRPLNREIIQGWILLEEHLHSGKSILWVRRQALSCAPAAAREWLARE